MPTSPTRPKAQMKWKPLKEGDLVDLIAPGFACKPEELEGAIRFLREWGLRPRVPQGIFGRDVVSSNDDQTRWKHLNEALSNPDSRAVWCLRGGYGSIRLLPDLARLRKPKFAPKLFVGLSDITSLHVFLNQKWGWPTIHGPLLDRLGRGATKPVYVREMKKLVFGDLDEVSFPKLKAMNAPALRSGSIKSSVSGGNLITLQSTLSTPWQWKTAGRILFFEDIGERGYRVDRVLEQFDQAGLFKSAKAVIFGDFTGGQDPDGKTRLPGVLQRFAEQAKFPVFSGLKSGHDVIQRPVPFETSAVLRLGKNGELVCQAGSGDKKS